ncbi:FtsK/SpoIIIE domain-containing protein [Mycolicibacterium houstonense]|uniref:FtsK/SpoIIIE domain-containing protein n=1 Tax=Mycolicibacterium houstonense TaxID=146021 RepID=UPI003F975BBF
MTDSARVKKLAREHMAAHPGVRYQQALDAVQSQSEPLRVDAGAQEWLHVLGGIPTEEEMAGRWAASAASPHLRWPAGMRTDQGTDERGGRPDTVWVDLAAPAWGGKGTHVAFAGRAGSGMTYALRGLMSGLAAAYGPDRVQFALADYRGQDTFMPCAAFPHTAFTATRMAHNTESIETFVALIHSEIRRRKQQLRACRDIQEYQAISTTGDAAPLPDLILIFADVDEQLLWESPRTRELIEQIAREGLSLGMHLVLASQKPMRTLSAMRLVDVRIALRLGHEDSALFIGSDEAASIDPESRGRGYLRAAQSDGDSLVPLRTFDVGAPAAQHLWNRISSMPTSATYRIAEPTTAG